jgi:para-nitrobenzyl esterase
MPSSCAGSIVETCHGRVRGTRVDGVDVFKGVRYGATTAGANRFLPPRTPAPWPGEKDAVTWPASAPQNELIAYRDPFYAWCAAIQTVSEDCLFLNVFTPGLDVARRPVMVWLHGGGWTNFAATAPGTDGSALAREQDVVVVSVNHRLNVFGFVKLDGGDERFADSGNAGLLDLVQALQWVHDNIAAFGGDPGCVTIFGQSGGASKVAALLAMPRAKGLFHRAIVQSMSGGLHLTEPNEAERQSAALAHALGRARLDGAALQGVPITALLTAMARVSTPFRPLIDGRSFTRHPWHPSAPPTASGVPLLVGTTATETSYYLRSDPRNFSLERGEVERRLARFLAVDGPEAVSIFEHYHRSAPDATPSAVLIAVTTDQIFRRNTLRLGSLQASTGNANVFAYTFTRQTRVEGGRLGAPHTSEIPFIFGTVNQAAAIVGESTDLRTLQAAMMSAWSAFARSGSPETPPLPRWQSYNDIDGAIMSLDVTSQMTSNPGRQARSALEGVPRYQYGTSRKTFVGEGVTHDNRAIPRRRLL